MGISSVVKLEYRCCYVKTVSIKTFVVQIYFILLTAVMHPTTCAVPTVFVIRQVAFILLHICSAVMPASSKAIRFTSCRMLSAWV